MSDLYRSEVIAKNYQEHRESVKFSESCALCLAPSLIEFDQWRVINNDYPYDLIASKHHMLIPKRHITEAGLSEAESKELISIKNHEQLRDYDYLIEAANHKKSIPQHFHIHLIVGKELRKDI